MKRFPAFGIGRRSCPGAESGERALFIEISTILWACSVVKKRDEEGNEIPIPWYGPDLKSNCSPSGFDLDIKVRDEKRMELLRRTLSK